MLYDVATRGFQNGVVAVDFILGLLTAWFGKKVIAFMDWTLGAIWAWWRASPSIRCYAVSVAYVGWVEQTAKQIESGKIDDPRQIESIKRFHSWNMARLNRWQDRVWDRSAAKS